MAEERRGDRPGRPEERTPETPQSAAPLVPKKKKKRGKGSLLLFLLILSFGIAAGLHFSGYWDARPLVWGAVPKIPYVGMPLAKFFAIPERYTLTVAERRAFELEEWQRRLDERERTLREREFLVEVVSGDVEQRSAQLLRRETVMQQNVSSQTTETTTDSERRLIEQVAKTYQDMSPRNAAQVVEQLREPLAVELLQKLPVDIRASILGKMQPQKAARLTELMATGR